MAHGLGSPALPAALVVLALLAAGCLQPLPGNPDGAPFLAPVPASPEPPVRGGPAPTPSGDGEDAPPPAGNGPRAFQLQPLISGLDHPVGVVSARDGTGRLFVVEQPGAVRVWKGGRLLDEPLLDLRGRVSGGAEQGLLSIAFAPDFRDSGRAYIYYTDLNDDAHLTRFVIQGDRADPASERDLLFIDKPAPVHNAGQLQFGPDGFLYVSVGDGGRNGASSQNLSRLFGKILRLDVSGDMPAPPPDNPFLDEPGAVPWTWVMGLRNPWHFSFDRKTGDIWIGDVGHSTREEVDFVPAGESALNFGWNTWEGTRRNSQADTYSEVTWPVAEYDHDTGCAVMGGYMYRGDAIPGLRGTYLYGDFCKGVVWGLHRSGDDWKSEVLAKTRPLLTSFGEDEDGELLVTFHGGDVFRLAAP
jgi:glucose/arabinose dehydrogenase